MSDASTRTTFRGRRVAVCFCWGVALAGLLAPTRGVAADWIKLTTPQFTVVSQVSESQTKAWAVDFELFRRALASLMPVPPERLEALHVVLFRSDRQFRPFKPLAGGKPAEVNGFFLRQPGRNIIALAVEGAHRETRQRIFHEATHWHLAAFDRDLPLWLNEGLAEVFGNCELREDTFLVGISRPQYLKYVHQFGPMPFAQLAATQHDGLEFDWHHAGATDLFYAQSWSTVHWLLFENGNELGRLRRFLQAAPSGADASEELLRAFGLTAAEVDRRLGDYVMRRRLAGLSVPLDRRKVDRDFVVQPVGAGDVDLALGELLLGAARPAEAAPYLTRAAAARPQDPEPVESLGEVALAAGRSAEAQEHFARSLALGGTSFTAYYFAAMSEWSEHAGQGVIASAVLDRVVRNLRNALAGNPRFLPGYETAGLLLGEATDPAIFRQLEPVAQEGARRFPAAAGVQIGLGFIALRGGDIEQARLWAERARGATSTLPDLADLIRRRLVAAILLAEKIQPGK